MSRITYLQSSNDEYHVFSLLLSFAVLDYVEDIFYTVQVCEETREYICYQNILVNIIKNLSYISGIVNQFVILFSQTQI